MADGVLQVIGTNGSDAVRLHQLRRGRTRVVGNILSSGRNRDFNLSEVDSFLIMLGDGNDRVNGGNGKEPQIGGEGTDRVGSRGGEDIPISGSTTFDEQQPTLNVILDEWTSSRYQPTRIENVEGIGTGPRLNENFFLLFNSIVTAGSASDQILEDDDDWVFTY